MPCESKTNLSHAMPLFLSQGVAVAWLSFFLSGCAAFRETPPTYSKFLDTDYAEVKADPGRMVEERIARGGDDRWVCGFIHFATKEVWLSRDMNCDWDKTRLHEKCHLDAFNAKEKDNCHDGRTF